MPVASRVGGVRHHPDDVVDPRHGETTSSVAMDAADVSDGEDM